MYYSILYCTSEIYIKIGLNCRCSDLQRFIMPMLFVTLWYSSTLEPNNICSTINNLRTLWKYCAINYRVYTVYIFTVCESVCVIPNAKRVIGNRPLISHQISSTPFLKSDGEPDETLAFSLAPTVCFQILGTWTMFPLLKRDGLQIPFYIVIVLFVTLNFARHLVIENKPRTSLLHWLNLIFVFMSSAGMIFLLTLEAFVKPPLRYPDLYPALFSILERSKVYLC